DSTYALRAMPFLASCLALIGLVQFGRRCLPAPALPWLAAFVAFSDHLLWHCCEAKPYAVDALVAVGLLGGFVAVRAWTLPRQLLLWAALSPFVIFLTYPGCFLLGGLALSLLPAVWRERRLKTWAWYGLFGLVMSGSFLLLLLGPARAQRDEHLLDCWRHVFPQWHKPWTVPLWLVQRLLEVGRYANEPIGHAMCVLAVVGVVVLWQRGQQR